MEALWISLGIVFVAELGDKTQLVALSFGARQRVVLVILGFALAQIVTIGVSVLAGGALGAAVPERVVGVGAALAFFAFALWTLRERGGDDDGEAEAGARAPRPGRLVVLTVFVAVLVAELGDKTMLAAATLATRQDPWLTWIGGTVGVVAAGTLAILAGSAIGARVSRDLVRRVAAALFALFGVLLLVDALLSS